MEETIEYKGGEISIQYYEFPLHPRVDWDNLGTMVCFHGRYNLGDENHGYNQEDYNSWEELFNAIDKREDALMILPLYLYDHSVISIKVGSWLGKAPHAQWDSGQVGFIFISKEKVRKEFAVKRISKKLSNKIYNYLEGEVETYDQYLRGEVYAYQTFDEDGEIIDSCGGYFGNPKESGLMEDAMSDIDNHNKRELMARIDKVKSWIKNNVPLQYRELPKLI